MCQGHGLWSSSALCGFNVGGACMNTTCICQTGFKHDLSLLRQHDCSLPNSFIEVVDGISLFNLIIGLFYCGRESLRAVATAKLILIVCTLKAFFAVIYFADRAGVHNKYEVSGLIVVNLVLNCSFLLSYISLFSVATPLYRMAERSHHRLKSGMQFFYCLFRIPQIIFVIIGALYYHDSNNSSMDHGWNVMISYALLAYGVEVTFLCIGVIITGKRMCWKILSLIKLTPDNPNHAITYQYVSKIEKLVRNAALMLPFLAVACFSIPTIYLGTGYMPFAYIAYTCIVTGFTGILFIFAFYATREKTAAATPAPQRGALETQQQGQAQEFTDSQLKENKPKDRLSNVFGFGKNKGKSNQQSTMILSSNLDDSKLDTVSNFRSEDDDEDI